MQQEASGHARSGQEARGEGVSIDALNWAFNLDLPNSGQKIVLLVLANYADDEGKAFPSQKTLSEKTCLSERAIRDNLTRLEEVEIISRVPRCRSNGSYTTDLFKLNVGAKAKKETLETTSNEGETQRQILPTADLADGRFSQTQRQNLPQPAADSAGPEPSLNTTITKNNLSSESARELNELVDLGVHPELAEQWLNIRDGVTERMSFAEVREEAGKAGFGMQRAVELCVERRWSSFKASWYAKLVDTSALPLKANQNAPPWWGETDIRRLLQVSNDVRWWLNAESTAEMAEQLGEGGIRSGETFGVYLDRLREKLMEQWRAKSAGSTGK